MTRNSRPEPPNSSAPDIASRLRQARIHAFLGDGSRPQLETEGGPQGESGDLEALLVRTAAVYSHSVMPETRATYARRWRLFEAWCIRHSFDPLPASADVVMLYISDTVTEDGVALSTVRGWMAAINRVHLEAGATSPGEDPAMTMFLRGLARSFPPRTRPQAMSALRINELRQVCRSIDSLGFNPPAIRDRAILNLHRLGFGDGELSRIRWDDISITNSELHLAAASVRQGRPGHRAQLRLGERHEAETRKSIEAWRSIASATRHEVFTYVDNSGWCADEPLSARAVFKVRKSRLDSLGPEGGRATVDQAIELLTGPSSEALRDKAALLLGFAGAFRRNEITGLHWSDVRPTDGGLILRLRRSKTDTAGRGQDVGIPNGRSDLTCPVKAVEAWRLRSESQLGSENFGNRPVFVTVGRAGRLGNKCISSEALTRLVQRRADQAGIEGRWGGRSLRAGFISTAADLDIPLESIARQSRHATLDSLIRYIRTDDPFRRNSADKVGL